MRRELILLQRAWRGISALLDDDAKSCRILSRTDQSLKVVHSGLMPPSNPVTATQVSCGRTAETKCANWGSAICSDCCVECCGDSFCELCYDYHVTHSCVRKPVQNETKRHILGSHKAS
jgi:hypothetical protein